MTKRFYAYATSLIVTVATILTLNGLVRSSAALTIDNTPDCDNVAIIKCGAMTADALRAAYDANAYGDLPTVFNAFNISRADLNGTFVDGIVWKDGRVTVNDKVVATNAYDSARNWGGTPIPNTKNAAITSVSTFVTDGQTALVRLDANGAFQFAVVKTCGNPVKAIATPVPAATCKALTATQISRTEFSFAGTATVENGATVSKYTFVVKNSAGTVVKTVTVNSTALSANSGTITLDAVGVYTVALTVTTSLGDKTATGCQTTVEVKPAPVTPAPGVSIDKKVDGVDLKTVQLNTPFTYQIVVKNTGNVDLVDAVVSDTAPAGVTFVSAGTGTIANNAWTTTTSLKVGESKSFTITAKVEKYVAGNIVNTACVNAKEVNPSEPTKADDCDEATVNVPEPSKVTVCDPTTGEIITVKDSDKDKYKPTSDASCTNMSVCIIATKETKTIKTKDFTPATMSNTLSDCTVSQAPAQVVTVANTGPEDFVMGGAGLSTLTAAGYYFRASRRNLMSTLLKR